MGTDSVSGNAYATRLGFSPGSNETEITSALNELHEILTIL